MVKAQFVQQATDPGVTQVSFTRLLDLDSELLASSDLMHDLGHLRVRLDFQ